VEGKRQRGRHGCKRGGYTKEGDVRMGSRREHEGRGIWARSGSLRGVPEVHNGIKMTSKGLKSQTGYGQVLSRHSADDGCEEFWNKLEA